MVMDAKSGKEISSIEKVYLEQRRGPHFEDRLKAYVKLKELQGISIPNLLLFSRSCCGRVCFLGIELGIQVT